MHTSYTHTHTHAHAHARAHTHTHTHTYINKDKVKFILEQATKAQRGSRDIALLFLEPRCYIGVGGQCYAPAALTLGKTWYPLYRRLGGPQGWSRQVWKISPPLGFDPPTIQTKQVTIPTTLSWPLYIYIYININIQYMYTRAV
jgi:hypothetical protein